MLFRVLCTGEARSGQGGHQAKAAAADLGDNLVSKGQMVAGGCLVVPALIVPPATTIQDVCIFLWSAHFCISSSMQCGI